jgi:meiotic recombination protein REC8
VHYQQWEYLLADTQTANNNIRSLLKVVRNDGLDQAAGKARYVQLYHPRSILLTRGSPEQLILLDDPAFLPENGLPNFDFSNLDLDRKGDSQRSSQSMLSIRHRSGSASSSHGPSVLGLNIPSSSNGGAGTYQLPDPFQQPSGQNDAGLGLNVFGDDEVAIYNDDEILFDFGDDGELRDIPASERQARRAGSVRPQGRLGSDSAASGRVRKEHEDGLAGRALAIMDGDGDFNMFHYDDDQQMLPDADPFPVMTGGLGASDRPLNLQDEDRVVSEEPSSEYAGAPQKRKKTKAKKKVAVFDESHEINNGTLSQWQKEYVAHQVADKLLKVNKKAASVAKKNGFHFVVGSGLNGVGEGIGSAKFASPLEMFSGVSLLAKITGEPAPSYAGLQPKKGSKRAYTDEEDEEQLDTPSKRAREDEVGRAFEDDGMILNMDFEPDVNNNSHEQSIEHGRDAPSALPDYPSSAMPWNVSASLHSHQRGQSSSIQGRAGVLGSQLGSVGRRLTSASPLIGRGSALPGDLEQFSQLMDDPMVMYGRDDEDLASQSQAPGFGGLGGGVSSSQARGHEEFEIFGAAAGVDTQTAGSSQWVKQALDRESNNFFEYVKNTINEKLGDELGVEGDVLGTQEVGEKSVTFEELFVPENNSCIVAAQAFYHVLCLATRSCVWVQQTVEDMEPYGEIRIGLV